MITPPAHVRTTIWIVTDFVKKKYDYTLTFHNVLFCFFNDNRSNNVYHMSGSLCYLIIKRQKNYEHN